MDCMAASIACSALLDFGDKHKSMTANARGILPSGKPTRLAASIACTQRAHAQGYAKCNSPFRQSLTIYSEEIL